MALLADRYELGDELGRGGMARVVAAHDTLLDRPVAVKLLTSTEDPVARARFLREGRTAARVHHPAAVAVYDTGEVDGQPYLVMERIEGTTLSQRLREQGPLEIDEAVAITAGVLEALDAAHRAGMVHRDVKPANVFLPDDGGVKLGDFGIAKALDDASSSLTATGAVMGTPTYLAPELVEGEQASSASDVYGVGCLLYAQLAGQPPFHEGGPVAVAYAHRHQPVPPIEAKRPDVPARIRAVLERSLAKDAASRYPDAAAMRAALLGLADGSTAAASGAAAATDAGADARRSGADPTMALDDDGTGWEATALQSPGQHRGATGPARAGTHGTDPQGPRRSIPWGLILAVILLAAAWWLAGQPGLDAFSGEVAPPPQEDGDPDTADEQPADGSDEADTEEPGDDGSDAPAEDQQDPADEGGPGGGQQEAPPDDAPPDDTPADDANPDTATNDDTTDDALDPDDGTIEVDGVAVERDTRG